MRNGGRGAQLIKRPIPILYRLMKIVGAVFHVKRRP